MLRRVVVDVDHSLMDTKTAELDLAERLRSNTTAPDRHHRWSKVPGGPWIIVRDQLETGQRQVFGVVKKLLNIPKCPQRDLLLLWPELISDGAVEIRLNLRDNLLAVAALSWPPDAMRLAAVGTYEVAGAGGSGGVASLVVGARSFVTSSLVPTICLSMKS
jgi:hypothetical protein